MALGHVRESQLRWCYENAAVVLCPSVQEGFGLPAVEALEFGARVVTSTDPALVEVTGDRATHLPTQDRRLWVDTIVATLNAGARDQRPTSPRTWDDVAAETVMAVHNAG
jgi:glycosyltransferase involved in cell wall biosynthesis